MQSGVFWDGYKMTIVQKFYFIETKIYQPSLNLLPLTHLDHYFVMDVTCESIGLTLRGIMLSL